MAQGLQGFIKQKLYKENKMNFIERLLWLWKRYRGKCYIITPVKEGLREDEVLFCGHKIYVLEKKEEE